MISIVICSVKPELLEAVTRNIEATIGVPYQLIAIDNRQANRGLCAVYNEGGQRARHDIVCFMHEDLELLEVNWGLRVVDHFQEDDQLGAIGVAGARFKSRGPSGWMAAGKSETNCMRLYQRHRDGTDNLFHLRPAGDRRPRQPVCTLDGVWICARREVVLELPFNEALPPFHFYDIDFALRVSRHYGVAVVYDVGLRHFSEGHFDARWMRAALDYQALREEAVARVALGADDLSVRVLEQRGARFWMKFLRKVKAPWRLRWEWVQASGALGYPKLWWLAVKFLCYYPLKFR